MSAVVSESAYDNWPEAGTDGIDIQSVAVSGQRRLRPRRVTDGSSDKPRDAVFFRRGVTYLFDRIDVQHSGYTLKSDRSPSVSTMASDASEEIQLTTGLVLNVSQN